MTNTIILAKKPTFLRNSIRKPKSKRILRISESFLLKLTKKFWSCCRDLNSRPLPYQGSALPTELQQQIPSEDNICNSPSLSSTKTFFFRFSYPPPAYSQQISFILKHNSRTLSKKPTISHYRAPNPSKLL